MQPYRNALIFLFFVVGATTLGFSPKTAQAQICDDGICDPFSFGPLISGDIPTGDGPPLPPFAGFELNNVSSDFLFDFSSGGVLVTADIERTAVVGVFEVTLTVEGDTTVYISPTEAPPSAPAFLSFTTTEVFTAAEIAAWSYGELGVTVPFDTDAPTPGPPSGTITLGGPLGSFADGDVIELYEFGGGELFLGFTGDIFGCDPGPCTTFDLSGVPGFDPPNDTSVSLLQLAPVSDTFPARVTVEYSVCWTPAGEGDPRPSCDGPFGARTGLLSASAPEPMTAVLLALGIGGLGLTSRRTRRARTA